MGKSSSEKELFYSLMWVMMELAPFLRKAKAKLFFLLTKIYLGRPLRFTHYTIFATEEVRGGKENVRGMARKKTR